MCHRCSLTSSIPASLSEFDLFFSSLSSLSLHVLLLLFSHQVTGQSQNSLSNVTLLGLWGGQASGHQARRITNYPHKGKIMCAREFRKCGCQTRPCDTAGPIAGASDVMNRLCIFHSVSFSLSLFCFYPVETKWTTVCVHCVKFPLS